MTVLVNFDLTWDMGPPWAPRSGYFDEQLCGSERVAGFENAIVEDRAKHRDEHADEERARHEERDDQRPAGGKRARGEIGGVNHRHLESTAPALRARQEVRLEERRLDLIEALARLGGGASELEPLGFERDDVTRR
jgi:hypothetical protein